MRLVQPVPCSGGRKDFLSLEVRRLVGCPKSGPPSKVELITAKSTLVFNSRSPHHPWSTALHHLGWIGIANTYPSYHDRYHSFVIFGLWTRPNPLSKGGCRLISLWMQSKNWLVMAAFIVLDIVVLGLENNIGIFVPFKKCSPRFTSCRSLRRTSPRILSHDLALSINFIVCREPWTGLCFPGLLGVEFTV
jgi:hypothetical protein